MERESLYAAICANPRDDLPKLVFADWLDEHGDAVDRAHAELIRIQCEWDANARGYERALEPYRLDHERPRCPDEDRLAKENPDAAKAFGMIRRAEVLNDLTKGQPVMPLPEIPGLNFRTPSAIPGIQSAVEISHTMTWDRRLEDIRNAVPIRHLNFIPEEWHSAPVRMERVHVEVLENLESLTATLANANARFVRALLSSAHARQLRSVSTGSTRLEPDWAENLLNPDRFSELQTLNLGWLDLGRESILEDAGRFPKLRTLILQFVHAWRDGGSSHWDFPGVRGPVSELQSLMLLDIADSPQLGLDAHRLAARCPKLATFATRGMSLSGRCATDLLTSGDWPDLRHVDIGDARLGDFVGHSLIRANAFPRLHSLRLVAAGLTKTAIASLARWPGFGHLRKLVLNRNVLNYDAIVALGSADAPNLRTLGLRNCRLHGSHVRELAQSRFVRTLWSLDLRGNEVDDAFIRALIETPFLDALQCLLLDLPEGDADFDRLKARFGDRFQSE